jgi:glycosyltransferase involved in cell wall biosynthesis
MRTLFCNSPYGAGGIGQHFAYLVEASRAAGALSAYVAPGVQHGDDRGTRCPHHTFGLTTYTPIRFFPAWKSHVANDLFDRRVASRLDAVLPSSTGADRAVMGFVGKSLHTFRRARDLGVETLEVVAANSHVQNVQTLHARAAADAGLHDSWLNETQVRRTLREYDMADRIYVHSDYVRDTMLAAGIAPAKLVRTELLVDRRFQPPTRRPDDEAFRMVYVGRVEMTKGMALLLDAFERLRLPNATLTIVGGWSTRAVRQFIEPYLHRNPGVRVAPGDPLPALQRADVFVHPTYEDGFGYAPMEALACGVPAIVTEDTGMKEYVCPGSTGYVVPTGDLDALCDRILDVYQHPMAATSSFLPQHLSGTAADAPPLPVGALATASAHP